MDQHISEGGAEHRQKVPAVDREQSQERQQEAQETKGPLFGGIAAHQVSPGPAQGAQHRRLPPGLRHHQHGQRRSQDQSRRHGEGIEGLHQAIAAVKPVRVGSFHAEFRRVLGG